MTTSRSEVVLDILQEHFNPREEGWLWVALYADDRDGGVVSQIEGEYDEPTATAQALGRIINGVGPDHAYLALCRQEGDTHGRCGLRTPTQHDADHQLVQNQLRNKRPAQPPDQRPVVDLLPLDDGR
jgi:hypothetical protein